MTTEHQIPESETAQAKRTELGFNDGSTRDYKPYIDSRQPHMGLSSQARQD